MKVVFMGTGDIALPSFRLLVASEFELIALVTQPDKPVGRKQVLTPPRIKELAIEQGVDVLQPERMRDIDAQELLRAYDADIFVVMAYGQILPVAILEMPKLACINLHASLLPKHRGASCIQTAIAQGDPTTGITVMHMTKGLDEGDVILRDEVVIGSEETGGELHDRLAEIAPQAMLKALQQLVDGSATREAQIEADSNYAPKLLRSHGEIDWTESAEVLEKLVRGYDPWPGTFTTFTDAKGRPKRLKIFPPVKVLDTEGTTGTVLSSEEGIAIACGHASLLVTKVQPEGSKQMQIDAFLQGGAVVVGSLLGGE